MKRLLFLLVSLLVLLMPVLAMGEAAETMEYVDPNGRFAFAYPADWTVLTPETIDALVAKAEQEGNEGYKVILETLRPQIEGMGLILLTSADMVSSINIIPKDAGEEVTSEMLAALKESVIDGVSKTMGDVTFAEEPGMVEMDDGRQILMARFVFPLFEGYELFGAQGYAGAGNTIMSFNMTSELDRTEADTAVLKLVLNSMKAN